MKRFVFGIPLAVVLTGWTISTAQASPAQRQVSVPAGTLLHLRLDEAVGSDISRVEQPVSASVTRPVVVHGVTVVPAGSTVLGHVVAGSQQGGPE